MLTRRNFLLKAGLATPLLFGGYAFGVEPRRLLATQYQVAPRQWAGGPTLRIAVLADIHAINPWMTPAHIEQIAHTTNALKPDIVLLAGDYEAGMGRFGVGSFVPMAECAKALSILRAPLGVHAVLGNHDIGWHDGAGVRRAFTAHGIHVMENAVLRLTKDGRPFWLLGLGDGSYGLDDLPGTLAKVGDDAPVILLAHEPDIFVDVPDRVALTVSGHTHGGQVVLPGIGVLHVPSRFGKRFAYGHVVEQDRHLVVSGGLGMTGLPVRFGVPPEIVMITLGSGAAPTA